MFDFGTITTGHAVAGTPHLFRVTWGGCHEYRALRARVRGEDDPTLTCLAFSPPVKPPAAFHQNELMLPQWQWSSTGLSPDLGMYWRAGWEEQGIQLIFVPLPWRKEWSCLSARSKGQEAPKQRACKRCNTLYLLLCLPPGGKMQTHSRAILIKHRKTTLNTKTYYFSAELDLMSYSHKNEWEYSLKQPPVHCKGQSKPQFQLEARRSLPDTCHFSWPSQEQDFHSEQGGHRGRETLQRQCEIPISHPWPQVFL